MSENEIKPVAWVDLETWKITSDAGDSFFTDYQDEDTIAVYDQSAIDRLTAELDEVKDDLRSIERYAVHYASKNLYRPQEILEIIQHHPAITEITKSYADGVVPKTKNIWEELASVKADRDAAVADVASLRERMLALEAQRDDFGSREWQSEKAKRQAEAERDEAQRKLSVAVAEGKGLVAALDRIVSLKMSMFHTPYDMIGECVNIAADAIDAARAEGGV